VPTLSYSQGIAGDAVVSVGVFLYRNAAYERVFLSVSPQVGQLIHHRLAGQVGPAFWINLHHTHALCQAIDVKNASSSFAIGYPCHDLLVQLGCLGRSLGLIRDPSAYAAVRDPLTAASVAGRFLRRLTYVPAPPRELR